MNDVRPTRIFSGPVAGGAYRTDSGTESSCGYPTRPARTIAQAHIVRTALPARAAKPAVQSGKRASARVAHRRIALHRAAFSRPHRIRKFPLVLVAVTVALVAVFAAPTLVAHLTGQEIDLQAQEEYADSTPRSGWERGNLPHLYQIDRQWADEPYAGGTVRKNGCGPTALSMVYVALTGRTDLDPAAMAAFSERNGFAVDGMTAWSFMTDGAAQLGLASEELPASSDAVTDALTAGRPIICSVRPGDFTSTGHFIVLAGIDENGQLVVHDPNSAERSRQRWDVDRVLSQCANLWAFSTT